MKTYIEKKISELQTIPQKKRRNRLIKQVIKKGWSDYDLYDLDKVVAKLMVPMLKKYKDKTKKYIATPNNLNMKQWFKIIDKMIKAFKLHVECDIPTKKEMKIIDEGLHLFAKHFQDLWL